MRNTYFEDAKAFASLLKKSKLKRGVKFGSFYLPFRKGVGSKIQYNKAGFELLNNCHEYTFKLFQQDLQVSLQLYESLLGHYRLFAYSRIGNVQGMLFSVNLTTEKECDKTIFLTQKIKFSEQGLGDKTISAVKRRQKQILLCEIYRKTGLDVTENNDLILGIFDPLSKNLVNTSVDGFLNNFIAVSILKGHFQGNKGYSLDILPSYQTISVDTEAEHNIVLPQKLIEKKGKRTIPLAFRYQILKRDNSKCVACGIGIDDGAILHIDHKLPFSLGGLTVLDNLQTLCSECNISKSNRFID